MKYKTIMELADVETKTVELTWDNYLELFTSEDKKFIIPVKIGDSFFINDKEVVIVP